MIFLLDGYYYLINVVFTGKFRRKLEDMTPVSGVIVRNTNIIGNNFQRLGINRQITFDLCVLQKVHSYHSAVTAGDVQAVGLKNRPFSSRPNNVGRSILKIVKLSDQVYCYAFIWNRHKPTSIM